MSGPYDRTPAPWTFDGDCVDAKHAGHVNGICKMLLTEDSDVNEQVEADAKLICAAPELLEACEMAYRLLADNVTLADGTKARLRERLYLAILSAKGGD